MAAFPTKYIATSSPVMEMTLYAERSGATASPIRVRIDPNSVAASPLHLGSSLPRYKRISDLVLDTVTGELFPIRLFNKQERKDMGVL
jgi:hypothetical protein